MTYGLIDRKNHKYYTYLSDVFKALDNKQLEYNWLIVDCECYPCDSELRSLFDNEYCWISGEELSALIQKEDFQWIWAVLCGFEKDIPLSEVLKYPFPKTQSYKGCFDNSIKFQHPLSKIEIIPYDSSYVLIISDDKELIDNYIKTLPNSDQLPL